MNTYPGALLYLQLVTAAAAEGVLDAYDVALLTTLAIRFADYDSGARAWPSLSTLAGFAGTSRAQAKRRLGKLEELGWISRTKRDRKPSVISLHIGTGHADPRVTQTLDDTGQVDPSTGHSDPTLGSGGPHPRVRWTPERTPRTYSKNEPQEQEGGAAAVEVAPVGVPEREAPPSPPPPVSDLFEQVDQERDEARVVALDLHGHLERRYAELHRLDDLEDLVRPVLAAGWSPEGLRDEILSRLPGVRHRCVRSPHRAIGYLLGDLKGEQPGDAPAPTAPRAPEQTARPRAQGEGPTPPPPGMEHLPPKPKAFTWDYWGGVHGIDVPPGELIYV